MDSNLIHPVFEATALSTVPQSMSYIIILFVFMYHSRPLFTLF